MFNIRIATEEDKDAWSRVAQESPNSTYGHTWEWKEVLEQGLNVKSLCLVAEEKGDIIGIYPGFLYPKFKEDEIHGVLKFMIGKAQVLWSPFQLTWDYGGPCVLPRTNIGVLEELLVYMEKLAKKNKAMEIRVSPFEGDELKEILTRRNYRISPRSTSIIDLEKSEEELESNCKKKWRQYVRKAKKNGISIETINNGDKLEATYQAIFNLHHRKNVYLPPYSYFRYMFDNLSKEYLQIRTAVIDDKIIGADLLFRFKDMVVERYRGVFEEYMNLRTHYLMVWSAILESKSLGNKVYDLGGMPSDENCGIYFFKSGWGGKIINVDWHVKDIKFEMLRKLKRTN